MQGEKVFRAVLCSIFVCAMLGCGENVQSDTAIPEETPKHISKVLDSYVVVNADVVMGQPEELYSYTAVYDVPDENRLKEVFMPNEAEVVTERIPEQWRYICESADGTKRASTAAGIYYMDNEYSYYYVLLSTGDQSHMFPESFPGIETVEEIPFAGREEAKEAVKEAAEQLDIRLAEEPFVFAGIDAEGLFVLYQEQLELYGEEMTQQYLPDLEIEPDMGCYYMMWRVLCPHSERLRNGNLHIGGTSSIDGAYVMAVYSPGGMTYFRTNVMFSYEGEKPVEQIIGVDKALEQIGQLYENVILTEEDGITITEISLEYVPVLKDIDEGIYEIVPAWCMYGKAGETDSPFIYKVDAQTGGIL